MCQECVDACKEYFPDREKDWGDLLMSFTAFPFGDPDKIKKQLKHLAEVGSAQVGKEMDEEYEKWLTR